MTKSIPLGVGIALAFAVPAVAQMADREPARWAKPVARADVEARIKERFGSIDRNRDGSISQGEATAAREQRRDERRDARFAALDANRDGSVSRAEFDANADARAERRKSRMVRGGFNRRHGGAAGREMGTDRAGGLFARADANGDGKVTLAEALARPLERFDAADANHDGTLSVDERRTARDGMRRSRRGWRG